MIDHALLAPITIGTLSCGIKTSEPSFCDVKAMALDVPESPFVCNVLALHYQ